MVVCYRDGSGFACREVRHCRNQYLQCGRYSRVGQRPEEFGEQGRKSPDSLQQSIQRKVGRKEAAGEGSEESEEHFPKVPLRKQKRP